MEIIDFVKEEYWLNPNHGQKGLESSQGSAEYIECLKWLHEQSDLHGFIEIGSAYGGSFHLWSTVIEGPKISIDMEPKGQYPQSLSVEHMRIRNEKWRKHFSNVHSLMGDSMATETIQDVKQILGEDKVSWLFIDGDHRYIGAKSDFENYVQFVKPGGYVAFHDIRMMISDMGDKGPGCGVFWDELVNSGKYEYWEFANIIGVIKIK
jgi:cephalosporin hydroxylase